MTLPTTMPLIVDNPSLQAAIIEYLARDQDTFLIARVPTFIQLFEAKMNRTLFVRQMEIRATDITDPALTQEPEFVPLPPDFQSMRRIRIASDRRKPILEYLSPVQLDERRSRNPESTGRPRFFTIFANELELYPTPDEAVTLEMIYRQNLPPLATNNTNWLLTLAPDAYLYGSLLGAAPYIKEDARIATWSGGMASALADLNTLNISSAFNAGPLQVRTDHRVR